jgi:hypothetical protein
MLNGDITEDEMKIRLGFVSNSSSCSFCIYGIAIDKSTANEGELEEKTTDSLLRLEYGEHEGWSYYIGRNWDSIKDDETGAQFKKSIEDEIERLGLGNTGDCCTHEEGWYNG